jgi:SAM-dependent methyltransferase
MKSEDARFYQDQRFYQLKRILTEKNMLPSPRAKWEFGEFLKVRPNRGGKLLDIGCGEGQFLHYARELGYDVYGLDIDEMSISVGKEYFNLKNMYAGDMDTFYRQTEMGVFDCITFFELLEHLEDPRAFLSKVHDLLGASGCIALSTPNAQRFTVKLGLREKYDYPPHHLTRWNWESLEFFIRDQGFEIITHQFTPQVLRYVVAGLEAWWGGRSRSADRFLDGLSKEKKYALWMMRAYLRFLDLIMGFESALSRFLRLLRVGGMSHFVIARKVLD